jgi:MFS family permease
MIVQGLAPSFWGSFSDIIGRRVIFIGTFVVYIISNIALGVSNNYGELMAFRALQAAGSAATISIGTVSFPFLSNVLTNQCRCWRNRRHYHIS